MRRSFRADLLLSTPPKRQRRSRRPANNPTVEGFAILLNDWVDIMGYDNFDVQDLADAANVKRNTALKYMRGYPCGKGTVWGIATYFAPRINVSRNVLHTAMMIVLGHWKSDQ